MFPVRSWTKFCQPFIILLLLNATIASINAQSSARLYVNPPTIIDPTLTSGKSFSINVTVANVTDLYGFEFKLRYNTTFLTGLGVMIVPFPNQTDFTSDWFIKDREGIIWVNVTYYSPAKPLTTTNPVTLATIFFLVETLGKTDLDLYDTKLVDDKADAIPHSVEDGYFRPPPIPGDVNDDGIVDIMDVLIVGLAFGSKPGDPNWNPIADLYPDNLIDVMDLVIVGVNFGRRW